MMNWDEARTELDDGKKARFDGMAINEYIVKMTYTDSGEESSDYVVIGTDDAPRFWRDTDREEGMLSEEWSVVS
ncbi:hypothetical protein [Klebsiella oxytoca]|uniref:hypothetical protein n=1 Tax=Klebsiella oxytoca TaxID=571 RepID=UPI001BD54A29|nr:hypothetical protein [Klebsiella oxytoca]ELG4822645.1 hypothetical protein [Klebsiella oxytoca]ELK5565812.1 hypothetical protein [Klebsiella oxytoca]ELK5574878.1 hypothetical protein [Klebsiella oxytoca]MDM4080320.1 hypothetical protein [Klebsiella oxytoca]MDM4102126.1 hypothetical protein [Klebsiella oxytoca]